ncbi:DoxX family protein [Rhodoligotrophos defluvii]|uniref:DoxX family protein n=1 Tax=Rhodoligotrophos defluvii TaxID=2561934 RepID=UPI0014859F92|nr:DoxX family protein [Rhodoligotrophos defluvii]
MTLADGLCWIVAAALLIHGSANTAGADFARRAFESFGYPKWMLTTVGLAELTAAALLLYSPTRGIGVAIAGICLIGAVGTLARQRAWREMEYPAILLSLAALIGLDVGGIV